MTIERNGVTIELTNAEKESVFREVEHKYRLSDARNHLEELSNDLDGDDSSLRKTYGVHFDSAIDETSDDYILEDIVTEYENRFDCNIDENTTWRHALERVLDDIKNSFLTMASKKISDIFDKKYKRGITALDKALDDTKYQLENPYSPKYILEDVFNNYISIIDAENISDDTAWYNACIKALEEKFS
ncbi:MAG: hypothetical protein IJ341_02620 [Bacteroidales bacterium]|nr:hypothetical protein [Bacteroidales bacterium]